MKNVDYKGKQLFSGDEYFIFENENGFEVVHCENLEEYIGDNDNIFCNYEFIVEYVFRKYGIYPEIYLENGEFR